MDSAGEDGAFARRKAAALRRREEHAEWKREFFQARPPPPPIGRLHRRERAITKDHSCHAAFLTALTLHRAGGDEERSVVHPPAAAAAAVVPLTSSASRDDAVVLTKQEAWAAQLRQEQARRNPATDLHIRSDPTRTVIMANLHPDTVDEDLRTFADQFGRVVHLRIVRHITTGKSRRYAFVEFGLAGEARRAVQHHRKKRLRGHAISIDREKGRTEPRFLPKRLATAEPFWSTVGGEPSLSATTPEEGCGAPAVGGSAAVTQSGAAAPMKAAAAPTLPEDDDDFLNSILNS